MTINNATLSVDVFNALRTVLTTPATPFITNSTTNATTLSSVNAAYNDKTPTRPQIIINPITFDEAQYKFGSSIGKKIISVTVDCYASNTLGTDQLGDQVYNRITSTDFDGMSIVGVTSEQAFTNPNTTKYQLKSYTFTFDRE